MPESIPVSGTISGTLSGDDGTNAVSLPLSIPVTGTATITPHSGGSPIARVGFADLGNNNGTTASLTHTYTPTGNALVVIVQGDVAGGLDDVTATFNGVAMTLADKSVNTGQDTYLYGFYLLNPAAGAHNIVISAGAAHWLKGQALDLSNVTALDAHTNHFGTGSSLVTALTTVANAYAVVGEDGYNGGANPAAGAGLRLTQAEAAYGSGGLFDSNGVLTAGSHNFTTTRTSSTGIAHVAMSFK